MTAPEDLPVPNWTVAGVQMDCKLGDMAANLAAIIAKLNAAADRGGAARRVPGVRPHRLRLRVSREQALRRRRAAPGPDHRRGRRRCAPAAACGPSSACSNPTGDGKLFNACALVGPAGFVASYRKLHLPCLGADRFTDPGDRPFAVHDLGGLKVGMNICFDGSFPEPPAS